MLTSKVEISLISPVFFPTNIFTTKEEIFIGLLFEKFIHIQALSKLQLEPLTVLPTIRFVFCNINGNILQRCSRFPCLHCLVFKIHRVKHDGTENKTLQSAE